MDIGISIDEVTTDKIGELKRPICFQIFDKYKLTKCNHDFVKCV